MKELMIAGLVLVCMWVFIVLRGPVYRGRERRSSGSGRGHW
jgi:hypothetical protein